MSVTHKLLSVVLWLYLIVNTFSLFADENIMLRYDTTKTKSDTVRWVVPPKINYKGVTHQTYYSRAMQTEVGYNIYFPDEYTASNKRYPVIYHLHGAGGNESSQIDLSEVYHRAINEKKMCPVIIVFVNGGKRSFYCDIKDSNILTETTIINELIPYIDSTYRTIAKKEARAIHGFSMGGFGALKLSAKYYDLFCSVFSFGGAMAEPGSSRYVQFMEILRYNDSLYSENSPIELFKRNINKLDSKSYWLFTGTRDISLEGSVWAHQFLQNQGIQDYFFISEDVGHALKVHYKLYGDSIFQSLQNHFQKAMVDKKK